MPPLKIRAFGCVLRPDFHQGYREVLSFRPHFTEETMEAQHQPTFPESPLDDGCLQWAWGYWPWVGLAEICPPTDRVLGSHCDQRPQQQADRQ